MPESIEYPFRYVLTLKASGDGVDNIEGDVVESGETRRIDHLACIDKDNACTRIEVFIAGDGVEYALLQQQAPDAGTLYWYNYAVFLEEEDYVIARFTGATQDDRLELHYMGIELRPRRR